MLDLELHVQAGMHALASVVSVLHARRAQISHLSYAVGDDGAVLVLRCEDSADAQRLVSQLDRRLDVTAVRVRQVRAAA